MLYIPVYRNCGNLETGEAYGDLEEFLYDVYGSTHADQSRAWKPFIYMIVHTETQTTPLLGLLSKDRIQELGEEWRRELDEDYGRLDALIQHKQDMAAGG